MDHDFGDPRKPILEAIDDYVENYKETNSIAWCPKPGERKAWNSKFGAMEFSENSGEAVLSFKLFIDGKEAYTQRVTAPKKS